MTITIPGAIEGADYATFAAGEIIMRWPVRKPQRLGYISRGVVACTMYDRHDPDNRSTIYLRPGDWIAPKAGEGVLMAWRAEDICVIALVDEAAVAEPLLSRSVLASLSRQKSEALVQSLRSRKPGAQRLEECLGDLAQVKGTRMPEGIWIAHLNRTELARQAGVGKEYVSRYISRLRERGLLETRNRGVLLKQPLGETS